MKNKAKLIVDGSCIANGSENANGGICAILHLDEKQPYELKKNIFVFAMHFKNTTNNQMELMSSIYGLNFFAQNFDFNQYSLSVESDSQYVTKGITNWIHNWKKKDWKVKSGEYRANTDLWKELDQLNSLLNPEWIKIARNSTFLHVLADKFANQIANSQIHLSASQIEAELRKC